MGGSMRADARKPNQKQSTNFS
uniref:Uncharacterized protein n=1 Tax=Arundo donax TaxID=35708 RepID=A0A0A8YMN6_ARUDO